MLQYCNINVKYCTVLNLTTQHRNTLILLPKRWLTTSLTSQAGKKGSIFLFYIYFLAVFNT
jgi:hypothetical protein